MASAKDEILNRIRMAHKAANPVVIPAPEHNYNRKSEFEPGAPEIIKDFTEKLVDYTALVEYATKDEVPGKIAEYLHDCKSVVVPSGLEESWKEAAAQNNREVREDSREQSLSNLELDGIDAVVTASRCGISLTGVIILDGEPDQGRRAITLIPDTHVVVINARDVYGTVSEAVGVLAQNPQRPITWIAGPSATSDIELIRVDGVHGPRNLRVIIVQD